MDVLRERECKDSIERQLADERKLRGESSRLSVFLFLLLLLLPLVSFLRKIEMFKSMTVGISLNSSAVCPNQFIRIPKYCVSIFMFDRVRLSLGFLFPFILSR